MSLWIKVSTSSGISPFACCAHSSCEIDGKLYIFGGWKGVKMLNDLYILEIANMTWKKPTTTGTGPRRAGHAMIPIGKKIFILGGVNKGVFYNDLHIFDTEKMEWSSAFTAGTTPGCRSRHTVNLIENSFYVFGGGDDGRLYNDLHVLNIDTFQWSKLVTKGTPPSPRWGHTSCSIDKKLYVFGGYDGKQRLNDFHVLNLETLEWSPVTFPTDSQIPPARAGHTMDLVERKLFLFGGADGQVLNDIWILDIDNLSGWVKINGTAPGRCAHSSVPVGGKLYIFGGGNGIKFNKELYIFDAEGYLRSEEAKKSRVKKKIKVRQKLEFFLEQRVKNAEQPEHTEGTYSYGYGEIALWLKGLKMEQYLKHFIREEIDMDIVPQLTEDHLIRLGIDNLEARAVLCSAIQKLKLPPTTNPNKNLEPKYSSKDQELFKEEIIYLLQSVQQTIITLTNVSKMFAYNS